MLSSSRHKETLKKSFIILCVGNLHEQTKVSFLKRPAATNETGSDVSALSPFTNNDTLRFHIRRAGYQLLMWKTANCCFLLLPVPAYMKYRNRTVMVAGFFSEALVTGTLPDSCIHIFVNCSNRKSALSRVRAGSYRSDSIVSYKSAALLAIRSFTTICCVN